LKVAVKVVRLVVVRRRRGVCVLMLSSVPWRHGVLQQL